MAGHGAAAVMGVRASGRLLLATLAAVGLSACGNSANDCTGGGSCAAPSGHATRAPGTTPAPSGATPSAARGAAQPVVVWQAADASASYLLDLSGHELGTLAQPGNTPGLAGTGAGESPSRLYTIANNTISFFGSHGTPLSSQPFDTDGSFFGPVFTPDDSSWLWATGGLNGGAAHSTRLLVGGGQGPGRVVAQHADPAGQQLTPIGWAGGLFYLSEQATNGGDQLVFPSLAGAWTLDPANGALRQRAGADCQLQDVAADGSLLCLDAVHHALTVRGPAGSATLQYPSSWEQAGRGSFSPDGRRVIIATASPSQQQRGVYTGPASGGPMSVLPGTYAVFLPDGRILTVLDQGGYDLIGADGATVSVEVPAELRSGSFAGLIPHASG